VIHDADRSLAAWLASVVPRGTEISFEAPEPSWADRPLPRPLLSAFLYDIREDIRGLAADWSSVRDTDGRLTGRQLPIRRYRLSYLLTAWTAGAAAGHELLGSVMTGCAEADVIPAGCLHGTLLGAGFPVPLRCAPADRSTDPIQLWQSLRICARAGLDLAVTAAVVPALHTDLAPPARQLDLDMTPGPAAQARAAPAAGPTAPPLERPGNAPPGGSGGARSVVPPGKHWERGRISEPRVP